jgi:hypothetical protein
VAKRAEGTFENKGWDEKPTIEFDGGKITRATVEQAFTGDLAGDAKIEWLMHYAPDGTASFVGIQHMDARLDGRAGIVVLQTTGVFDGTEARGEWLVLGATGDLEGMKGTGRFAAPHGPNGTYTLDYDL